jgi:hypothetical protein
LIGHEKGEVFGPGFPKGPHIVGSVWGETGTTTEEDEVIEQCREAGHELLNKRRARDSKETKIPKALLESLWHGFRVNKVARNLALNAPTGFA